MTPSHEAGYDALAAAAAAVKRQWRAGAAPPDARRAVDDRPDLTAYPSLAVDLAYEEYCLRDEAGAAPDAAAFCEQFPEFRTQLREAIRGYRLLADNPDLFDLAPNWPGDGAKVGTMTIVRELGRGAFARVYLATDPETGGRPVALKLSPNPTAEAKAVGPIRHPNVGEVLWAGRVDGWYAVCMPYVAAATLQDAIGRAFAAGRPVTARPILDAADSPGAGTPRPAGPPSRLLTGRERYADAVAAVAARLAAALGHLSDVDLAHGDLKPTNILLAAGGHPYLIDFNLSADRAGPPARVGGTLPYMAPERLRLVLGRGGAVGDPVRADLYAFGAVLFEALTGRVPLVPHGPADDPVEVAADLLCRQDAGDLAVVVSAARLPGRLARLIASCLAINPSDRPASFTEVRQKLDRFLGRHRWRRPAAVAVAVVTSVAAITLTAPAWSVAFGTARTQAPAPQPATADEFVARGMSFLKTDHPAEALADFAAGHRLRPDALSAALMAHCYTLTGSHRQAVALYQEALTGFRGAPPAWVHNNYSFSLLSAPAPADGRDPYGSAIEQATLALARGDNRLRAARLNRADAQYRRWASEPNHPCDPWCVDDARAAIEADPQTPDAALMAARAAFAAADGLDGRAKETALVLARDCLAAAVRAGKDPRFLEADPHFRALFAARQDYADISKMPIGLPPPAVTRLQLLDPFDR